jgi:hypothetical protein
MVRSFQESYLFKFTLAAMLLIGVCGVGVTRLGAQGTTATVLGTVADMSGAAIPDAMVQVKNVGTGVTQSIAADAQGRYRVPDLSVGDYEVQATKAGFSTVVHKGITLTVGAQAVVDFSLQVGQQTQTVTVEGQASAVETTNAAIGSVTSEQQMRELPLNGRNFEQLIQLAPGVATVQFANNAMQGRAAQYSVAGSRPEGQSIMLDDENLQSFWNNGISSISGSSLGVEAIGEFQTLTNSFSAQFGGNGAVVNAVSRSGTNSFHGSAFDFLRNSDLDARDFFLRTRSSPPPFRRNQYGGSVGGPVVKDKAFFFVDYEGIRQLLQQFGVATVPNCPSACAPAASDSLATATAVANTLALYPKPTVLQSPTATIGQATTFGNQTIHEDYVLTRFDYTFSAQDSIFARYFSDKTSELSPFAGAGIAVGGGPLPYWPGTDGSLSQYTTVEERHIFSPTLVNLAKISYSRPTRDSAELTPAQAPNGTTPLQFFNVTGLEDGFINDVAAGLTPLGPATGTGHFTFAQNRYGLGDDLLWTHGAHSIRMGFAGDRLLNNSWNPISENVNWTFTSLANLLAGQASVESGVVPGPNVTFHRDYFQYDFNPYVEDDWKVTSKLTLNLGLRWEYYSNPTERHDNLYTITNYFTATSFTKVPAVFASNPSLKDWDPRFGLAYDPFADHKTSIRAGFGIFHDPVSVQAYQTGYGAAPPSGMSTILGTTNPATNTAIYPFVPSAANAPIPSVTLPWYYPNHVTPYMIQYNVNVQREVLANTVLTVGYVGSHGVHLFTGIEANPPIPTVGPNGAQQFCVPNATGTACAAANPRQDPALGYFPTLQPISTSQYNALQVSVNRRVTRNVQMQASYTWSKCMDDGAFGVGSFNGPSTGTTPSSIENPFNQAIDHAVCGFNIPQVLRINGMWALPFKGNRFVSGWQLSGILSAYDGVPLNVNTGFDIADFGSGNTPRPNYAPNNPAATINGISYPACNNSPIIGSVSMYFNPNCYSIEPAGTFGNTGRNTLTGPGFFDTDMALLKDTVIREQIKLQFRAEIFNIFNHENFSNPGNNVFSASRLVNTAAAGVITGTNAGSTPRQIQFGLKLTF